MWNGSQPYLPLAPDLPYTVGQSPDWVAAGV